MDEDIGVREGVSLFGLCILPRLQRQAGRIVRQKVTLVTPENPPLGTNE